MDSYDSLVVIIEGFLFMFWKDLWLNIEIYFFLCGYVWNFIILSVLFIEFCLSRIKFLFFFVEGRNVCILVFLLLVECLLSELFCLVIFSESIY